MCYNIRPPGPLVLSTSDDNLLKNIELFDKLALRFHGRLLFLKDVLGDEICCWSFYGQGRKIAEVCCTSIVYATEKKQTKVRRGSGPGRGGLWWWAAPGPWPEGSTPSTRRKVRGVRSCCSQFRGLVNLGQATFLLRVSVSLPRDEGVGLEWDSYLAHLGLKAVLKQYAGLGGACIFPSRRDHSC